MDGCEVVWSSLLFKGKSYDPGRRDLCNPKDFVLSVSSCVFRDGGANHFFCHGLRQFWGALDDGFREFLWKLVVNCDDLGIVDSVEPEVKLSALVECPFDGGQQVRG